MHGGVVLTREQVRRVDRIAVERYGMSGLVLMENAGRGVVDVLLAHDFSHCTPPEGQPRGPGGVAILCGKGNNAGDGFVIARHLEIRGIDSKVLLLFPRAELTGDARQNYEILTRSDVPIIDVSTGSVAGQLDDHAGGATWLIDALLGTGAVGDPRTPVSEAVEWMNSHDAWRLAVDVPTGLDCDTGARSPTTLAADVTCTFVALKPGFLNPLAKGPLGHIYVIDIGVPPRLVREVAGA
jgi:NAD(P)H-hydrate epimerase